MFEYFLDRCHRFAYGLRSLVLQEGSCHLRIIAGGGHDYTGKLGRFRVRSEMKFEEIGLQGDR